MRLTAKTALELKRIAILAGMTVSRLTHSSASVDGAAAAARHVTSEAQDSAFVPLFTLLDSGHTTKYEVRSRPLQLPR